MKNIILFIRSIILRMKVTIDVYEYIGQFIDDKDFLNMLSVNKKFNDSLLFERALRRKYPFLLDFKSGKISWRKFYVSMTFYISKMKQYFPNYISLNGSEDIGFIEDKSFLLFHSFDPHKIFEENQLLEEAIKSALISKDLKLILYFTDKLGFHPKNLSGFSSPLFVNQDMINFLENAKFESGVNGVSVKELIRPLLKLGLFNRIILYRLFILHYKSNHLIITKKNKKYYKANADMNKYLSKNLIIFKNKGFNRNEHESQTIHFIYDPSIIDRNKMNEQQRNLMWDEKLNRILFGIECVLLF